jgi:citrate lyase subunit beta/citryl-CoA lyase
MLAKSLASAADGLVLDLEDAVTPENKDAARAVVASWLADVDFGVQERVVRINPLDSSWGRADLEATLASPPDAYLVPKVSRLADVEAIADVVAAGEAAAGLAAGSVKLLVLGTETPLGVLNIAELPRHERVDALSWGAEDLSAALGARRNRDADGAYLPVFAHARIVTLLAACAAGVQPLDTVFVDFQNEAGLRAESLESAAMGFTGKMTIHPAQIDVVNEAFSPSDAEIGESRELLEVWEEKRAAGLAAFRFRGQMVDIPHIERASRILATAESIRARDRAS